LQEGAGNSRKSPGFSPPEGGDITEQSDGALQKVGKEEEAKRLEERAKKSVEKTGKS